MMKSDRPTTTNNDDTRTTVTKTLSPLAWVAIALVVIGALNWGLVGLFSFDLVAALFGSLSPLSRIIYVLVAVAGVYLLLASTRFRREPTAI